MLPKTLMRSSQAMFTLVVALFIIAANPCYAFNDTLPTIKFDFDVCYSFAGGSNADYSEFVPVTKSSAKCSQIQIASPGYLYRSNSIDNTHSCAPGVDNSVAMCVGAFDPCFYDAGNQKSIKFNVRIIPLDNGVGSIEEISFFEQAPEFFQFVNSGSLGPNNYPTKYGVRAYINNTEIFRQIDIPTSRTWNKVVFDFSDIPAFTVSKTTMVSFEILPYCTVGNGALVNAFDIDDLVITGGCNNVMGGLAFTQQETTLCPANDNSGVVTFNVGGQRGDNFSWVVTDENGSIVQIPSGPTVDFRVFQNGNYDVYHLAYDGVLNNFSVGNNISSLLGCFDLSNPVRILYSDLRGGSLTDPVGFVDAYICSNIFADNQVETRLNNAVGFFNVYLVYDNNGTIIGVQNSPDVDFSLFPEGTYFVRAASHNGQLFNTIVGENISNLYGCFALSSEFRVIKQFVDAGSISINGVTQIELCGAEATNIVPDVTGVIGNNTRWIVSNAQDVILNIFNDTPIDISNLNEDQIFIQLISSVGRIDGLQVNSNLNDVTGCFDISNQILINFKLISAGNVVLNDASFCIGDGVADLVDATVVGSLGNFFQFIVTDATNEIIALPTSLPFDVDDSEAGICILWYLAAEDNIDLQIGTNISDIQGGCFDLSEPRSFSRTENFAGEVSLQNGETSVDVCIGDSNVLRFDNTGESVSYEYVVTDVQNEIIAIPNNNVIRPDNLPEGICRVYGIAHNSTLNFMVGEVLELPQVNGRCFDLSSNFVEINKVAFEGGDIELPVTNFCVGDGSEVSVSGTVTNVSGDEEQLFLTDLDGNIVLLIDALPFNIEMLNPGEYILYNLASMDEFDLMNGMNIMDIDGECFDLSEGVSLTSNFNNGGIVSLQNGDMTIEICVRDTFDNELTFVSTGGGMNYQYVVTDVDDIIISIPDSDIVNFDNAPVGTCRVWGLAYLGDLNLEPGDELIEPSGLGECFDLSSNFVEVVRFDSGEICGDCPAVAGEVIINNNFFCVGDGEADNLSGNVIDAAGDFLQIVITDSDSVVINLPVEITFDIDDLPEGVCIIWSLASSEMIDLEIGDHINDYSATCFDLSVGTAFTRIQNFGGNVSLDDGETSIQICVGDTISDLLTFVNTGTSLEYQYVITDESNVILDLPIDDSFDFENAPAGICRVWGFAYSDNFNLEVGDELVEPADEGECFDISNNFIEVIRSDSGLICGDCPAEAGQVVLDNTFFCVGDGDEDLVTGSVNNASADFLQIIVTDKDSIIVSLIDEINFDVDSVAPGNCIVWNLASTESIDLAIGDHVSDYMGSCFELSSGAAFTRAFNFGGEVSLIDGTTTINICVGDTISDNLLFETTGNGSGYQYIITDQSNIILALPDSTSFDFESSPAGTCLVWGIAYSDTLSFEIGDEFVEPSVAGECYDISDNFIEVIRSDSGVICGDLECEVTAGDVILDETFFCVGDGIPDLVTGQINGASGDFLKIILTFEDSTVVSLFDDFNFDVDGAGAGNCLIWHAASTEDIILVTGDHIDDLQNTCFELSESVSITRELNNGGTVSLEGNNPSIEICVSDMISDELVFFTTGVGTNYQYIITDDNDMILALPANDTFDFSNSPVGTCRVWGIASSNPLQLNIGDQLIEPTAMGECFDLSANFIEVIRVDSGAVCGDMPCNVIAGELTLNETAFCVGDGIPDILNGMVANATGAFQQLVVTDQTTNIIVLWDGQDLDVDTLSGGVCLAWNIVSDEPINLEVGDNFMNITNDCFAISSASIFTKTFADGAEVSLDGGGTSIELCIGDAGPDVLTFDNNSSATLSYRYVITDTNNVVIALPVINSFDFDDLDEGTCRIWGVSFNGNSNLMIGDNLLMATISDNCFDLSDNFIEVMKFESGGPCQGITNACEEEMQDCDPSDLFLTFSDTTFIPGAAVCIPLTVTNFIDVATLQGGLMWDPEIMTFTSIENNAISTMNSSNFNIDTTGGVAQFVWIDNSGGGNAQTIQDGDVFFEICFDIIGEDDEKGLLKVTSDPILQFADSNQQVLDVCTDAGCMEVQTQNFTIMAESIVTSDTVVCVDIPAINFDQISGIQYTVEWDSTFMCLDSIVNLNTTALVFQSNFNQAGASKVRFVWTGSGITLPDGDIFYTLCFSIKNNNCGVSTPIDFIDDITNIEIVRENMEIPFDVISGSVEYLSDKGTVAFPNGTTSIDVCVGDLESDDLQFLNTSQSDDFYTYVITDLNDIILDVLSGSSFDFEAAPPGSYRIWGISHAGPFPLFPGDTLEDLEDDDCFAVSANFLEVNAVTSGPVCNSPQIIAFDITPNPAFNQVKVSVTKLPNASGNLSVINNMGQVFYSTNIEGHKLPIYNLDISNFPAGIYFMRVNVGDKVLTKRFVISAL